MNGRFETLIALPLTCAIAWGSMIAQDPASRPNLGGTKRLPSAAPGDFAKDQLIKRLGMSRFEACGLTRLADAELVSLEAEFRMREETRSANSLSNSASRYMRRRLWSEVTVHGFVRVSGDAYLVVEASPFSGKAMTKDLPIGVDELTLQPGAYWGKPNAFGDGVNDLVDSLGTEHNFLFATWTKLR